MAKMIISFEEIGGIQEFNGYPLNVIEAYIINKTADFLVANMWNGINDEDYVNYRLTYVDWGNRQVSMHIQIMGV